MFRRLLFVLALLFAAAPALAQSFPVTIKHALGETVIPAAPQRIVTLGWSSTDAAIALGTVPVGFPSFRSAGFDRDIVPWVEEAIAAAGAPAPVTFDDTAGAPIEKIAALKPDLILAVYSGITEDQLWFGQNGDDLLVTLRGTGGSDTVRVEGWYSDTDNRLGKFQLSDGQVLEATRVQQLVQAMADFSTSSGSPTSLGGNEQQTVETVIAANWKTT